ncbi:hypothetical protein FGKAn22_02410 [Ferrigenium kumadai]|uniref:Uncharacterized protein n=1 Tax=Ferrigenium kumadai TaxID=1682490 RepID=A0AAN1SX97_9PROT|nr:hypothetical protein [Ferrigenium kumadai]BBI98548.1 hypothetical protein FGKAn22_02410 [Ferrigenium kumadai]
MNYKLPFLKVIISSLYFSWTNKAELLRAIALPTLVLVVIWAVANVFLDKLAGGGIWVVVLAFGFGFSFFAVTCHRLILVESRDRYRFFKDRPGYRELMFLGWVVAIYFIVTILKAPFVVAAGTILGETAVTGQGEIVGWVKEIASIPALYVLARFSLIFPAAAIDNSVTMRWAWQRTKGNGWRIFLVVGLFPWLIESAIGLLLRQDASTVEWVLLAIFAYIGLAVGIIALSFTYREFAKQG